MNSEDLPVAHLVKGLRPHFVLLFLLWLILPLAWNTCAVNAEPNVFIGTSTGLPPDATIRKVSFARSGDELVTTFQVAGSITKSYSYQIAIVLSEKYSGSFSFKILTYTTYHEPGFYDWGTGKSESVRYEISGDTWTAWTPLSLLGYRVHFWVWFGTLSGIAREWVDFYPKRPYPEKNLEVTLLARLTTRLQPTSIASEVKLKLDGRDYTFPSNGELSVMVESAISHRIEVTSEVSTSKDTRYVFAGWGDDKSARETRSVQLDGDTTITVSYKRQFLLQISSTYGTTKGGGWYDEGATATFSVEPLEIPAEGFLGTLGVKHQFYCWRGDSSDTTSVASLSMDRPRIVTADWKTVYGTVFYGFIALVIIVPIVVAAVLVGFKRQRAKIVTAPSIPSQKPCAACGALIPSDSEYCDECGVKQIQEV